MRGSASRNIGGHRRRLARAEKRRLRVGIERYGRGVVLERSTRLAARLLDAAGHEVRIERDRRRRIGRQRQADFRGCLVVTAAFVEQARQPDAGLGRRRGR